MRLRPTPGKCHAHTKRGPCKRFAIVGGNVCRSHGGAAPRVKAKAKERIQEHIMNVLDPDRVLRTAAALAFSDITQIYDDEYKLKPLREWPEGLRQAVKRIEPRLANVDPGDGEADRVLRVELHDKVKPLEMLMKNLGLLEEKVLHTGGIEIKWQE